MNTPLQSEITDHIDLTLGRDDDDDDADDTNYCDKAESACEEEMKFLAMSEIMNMKNENDSSQELGSPNKRKVDVAIEVKWTDDNDLLDVDEFTEYHSKKSKKDNLKAAGKILEQSVEDASDTINNGCSNDTKSVKISEKIHSSVFDIPQGDDIPVTFYGLRRFRHIMSTVLNGEAHLFSSSDIAWFSHFVKLDLSSQSLFVRLLLRKYGWFFLKKESYDEVPDIISAGKVLCKKSDDMTFHIAEDENSAEFSEELVKQLTLGDLRSIVKSFGHTRLTKLKKQDLVSLVFDRLSKSKDGDSIDTITGVQAIAKITGPLIRICPQTIDLVERLFLVYYRWTRIPDENYMSPSIMVEIKKVTFPEYQVSRNFNLFGSHKEVVEYYNLLHVKAQMHKFASVKATDSDSLKQGWALCQKHKDRWLYWISKTNRQINYASSNQGGQSFSPGWVLTKIVELGLECAKMLKLYREETVNLCTNLTARTLFKDAVKLCKDGLCDPHLHPVFKPKIAKKLRSLEKDLRIMSRDQTDISIYTFKEPPTRTISAKKISSAPNARHQAWQGAFKASSVEAIALEHYAKLGYKGEHTETSIFTTLYILVFWDVIYGNIPDVFDTPYQTHPLDMFSANFYSRREDLIERRLQETRNGKACQYIEMVDSRERTRNTACIGISWNIPKSSLLEIAECLGGEALAAIFECLSKEYYLRKSGAPDLCLWNPDAKCGMLVEGE
ncbi:hypothetical protein H4219_000335 [Mycoemilia scoparia]|uniref:Fanconi-associated nuclease n=1 Tax=Mycoemilia scoparia TaxID=417184 RepID=A0A9W8AC95_9FUNG|nr:hypothetical protein H4219_000335 [Mycoemilia scoparia]